jgi:hypothetical protein
VISRVLLTLILILLPLVWLTAAALAVAACRAASRADGTLAARQRGRHKGAPAASLPSDYGLLTNQGV